VLNKCSSEEYTCIEVEERKQYRKGILLGRKYRLQGPCIYLNPIWERKYCLHGPCKVSVTQLTQYTVQIGQTIKLAVSLKFAKGNIVKQLKEDFSFCFLLLDIFLVLIPDCVFIYFSTLL
jgi:hypothetical protein